MMNIKSPLLVCVAVLIATASADTSVGQTKPTSSSGWSQIRGDSGKGVAAAIAKPPIKIDLEKQTAWETEIPGIGWSSPVYQDNLIWMTTSIATKATQEEIDKKLEGVDYAEIKTWAKRVELRAIAVDRDSGSIVHNLLLRAVDEPAISHPMNSFASPTPAIKDGRVVCHFGSYGTWCLDDKTGKEIWHETYVVDHSVGPGSSPVIFDDLVVLVCDGIDKQFIAARKLSDGSEVWKTDRPKIRAESGEFRKAYSTPLLIEVAGEKQLVIPGAQWISAYALDSGKEIWRLDHGRGFSVTPMASFADGVVVFSSGFPDTDLIAVDPSGSGDVTKTHLKWRVPRIAPDMPSLSIHEGHVYSISKRAVISRVDLKTGEVVNKVRAKGNFSSSPLLAADHLYFGSREGTLAVFECNQEMKRVAISKLGDQIMASPVLIDNDLLIRTSEKLIRIKP